MPPARPAAIPRETMCGAAFPPACRAAAAARRSCRPRRFPPASFDDLEAPQQMPQAVFREAEVVVRSVVNREEKPRRQQQLSAWHEHAEHLVNRALRLGQVLQDFGAQHHIEARIADAECLRIADDLNADAALDVEAHTPRKSAGVGAVLRADIERAQVAGVSRR